MMDPFHFDWTAVQSAVRHLLTHPSHKQVKREGWTVYRVEGCIRIDIHTLKENH